MLTLPQQLEAPTGAIFVSPNGASSGAGATKTTPVSMARAKAIVGAAAGNKTIVMLGGTYKGIEFAMSQPGVVIQAAKGETPVLDGTVDITTPWVEVSGNYVTDYDNPLGNVTEGAGAMDKRLVSPGKGYAANLQQIWVGNAFQDQVGRIADLAPGKFYVDLASKKLYLGSNPGTAKVRASKSKEPAISLFGRDCKVVGLTIFGYARDGIKFFSVDGSIEHCKVTYCGLNNVLMNATGSKLLDCELGYGGLQCLGGGWYTQGQTIKRCNIHHGNTRQFNPEWAATTLKMLGGNPTPKETDVLVFEDNYVHDSEVAGVWMDVNVRNASVKRNLIERVSIGVFFEISNKADIEDNLIRNCGNGVQVSCANDANIRFNTIVDCDIPVNIVDWGRDRNRQEAEHPPGDAWNTRRTVIENNLLVNTKGAFLRAATFQTELSSQYISSFKDNALVSATIPPILVTWSNASQQERTYETLDGFRSQNPGYGQNVVLYSKVADAPASTGIRPGVVVGGGYVSVPVTEPTTPVNPQPSTELETARAELAAVRQELVAVKAERTALVSSNNNLVAVNNALSSDKAALESANGSLTSSNSLQAETIKALEATNMALEVQVAEVQRRLDEAQANTSTTEAISRHLTDLEFIRDLTISRISALVG